MFNNNSLRQVLPNTFLESSLLISVDSYKSRGSAFNYVRHGKLFLVTAEHVLFEDDNVRGDILRVSCPRLGADSRYEEIGGAGFCIDLRIQKPIKSRSLDVAVIHIGEVSNESKLDSYDILYLNCVEFDDAIAMAPPVVDKSSVMKMDKVLLSNDVFLLGYPTSLGLSSIRQFNISMPLLRKGIVACINGKERTIILDCSVYPGNSGAPVYQRSGIVTNQFAVIGVVSQFIPYVQEWVNPRDKLKNIEYQNSGYSVITAMDGVDELIDENMNIFDSVA